MKRKICALTTFLFIFLMAAAEANAKTIYVGQNETYKTIKAGIQAMSSGDTLIIRNGTYTGINNMISTDSWTYTEIPDGSPGQYTTIKAETDFGVILDGQGQYRPVHIEKASYIKFQGLHVKNCASTNGGSNFRADNSNHIKVINCASEEAYFGSFWFRYCKYILCEGCVVWGRQTYGFLFGGSYGKYTDSQYNVVRRCLVRRDAHYYVDGGNHYAPFVSYWGDNTYFQNCISVDGVHNEVGAKDPYDTMAVFYTANGGSNYSATGCISINDQGAIALFETGASPVTLKDNIVLLSSTYNRHGVLTYANNITIENNTFGKVRGTSDWEGSGIGEVSGSIQSVKNNIIYGSRFGLEDISGNHTYNVLWNDANYRNTSPGSGETTSKDPLSNGLRYPCLIDSGSFLSSAGQSGGRVGAQVLNRIGVTGTLYGESGWNTVTSESLWPFPNEDIIRTKMRTYSLHGVSGTRGFCANGQTLTKYIWEYLGNPIPPEIYGSSGTTYPAAPTGLKVK